ncbi:hypothetical protein [Halobacillus amylolyticus]|uniref:Uncharacterized protein n=1 Tax=Halobacillus amylolyticus TaxID=2932259 RepID=A0ABY4H829_9BACI|nr:hypothetical protein [Halobacillus amylolyticus]UOR10847.1 hypothetical protein MUO15_14630 [Halobacillus amylolyticus]
MKNETYLDFCFIRKETAGEFSKEIRGMFATLFKGQRLHWYLEARVDRGLEIVIAEVKGMSQWTSEREAAEYLDEHACQSFWEMLQGYRFQIYPATEGCATCGQR